MKLKFHIHLSHLLLTAALSACSWPITEPDYSLRPITIEIVDEATQKPISGINVTQVFQTEIYGGCWDFFMAMCPTDLKYRTRSKESDDSGVVHFDQRLYDFTCDEYPSTEYLIVNMTQRPEAYEKYRWITEDKAESLIVHGFSPAEENYSDKLMTVNPSYKGKMLYSKTTDIQNPQDWWHGNYVFFDVETNSNGLSSGPQLLRIKLEKFIDTND